MNGSTTVTAAIDATPRHPNIRPNPTRQPEWKHFSEVVETNSPDSWRKRRRGRVRCDNPVPVLRLPMGSSIQAGIRSRVVRQRLSR
jgi:hypothetical protein